MKRAYIVAIGAGVLASGFLVSMILFAPRKKIVATLDGNKLSWVDSSGNSLTGCRYEIYNDDFSVAKLTENSYFVTKEKLIDEVGPERLENVGVKYTDDIIYLKWDEVKDKGTDNNLWVGLYNEKGRQLAYSNPVKLNFSSGIYKYVVEYNGEKYEAINNEFEVPRKELSKGITKVNIYAVDKRNNMGVKAQIPLYSYSIKLAEEDGSVLYGIEDSTQVYTYKAEINGEDVGIIESVEELNSMLVDKSAPTKVSDVGIEVADKKVSLRWQDSRDVDDIYNISISGMGESFKNTVKSNKLAVNKKSDMKGYYYALNKEERYSVADTDTLLEDTKLNLELQYGIYYFHIASVDNEGNISETKSFKVAVEEPLPEVNEPEDILPPGNEQPSEPGEVEKPDPPSNGGSTESSKEAMIKSMIVKEGFVSDTNYNNIIKNLVKLPDKVVNLMSNFALKVYVTDGKADDVYNKLTGEVATLNGSVFVDKGNSSAIVIEGKHISGKFMHEVGHALDYIYGKKRYLSGTEEFDVIYKAEKDRLMLEDVYKGSSKEYFAEAMKIYIDNASRVKVSAPKTYDYFKKLF